MQSFKHAFISYGRRESLQFVGRLHQNFRLAGFDVWFDKVNIPHAESYNESINFGIENAQNFIYIMAPRCMTSPYCLIELEYARHLGKRVIPINQMVIFDAQARELSQSDIAVLKNFYTRHGIKGVEIKTELDVLKRTHEVIGTSDWLPAREKLNEEDIKNIAKFQSENEDNWKFHADLNYLKDYKFTQIGESIDSLEIAFDKIIAIFKKHENYNLSHSKILSDALVWEKSGRKTQFLLVGEERKSAEKWLLYRFPQGEQAPCQPSKLHIIFLSASRKNAENLTTDAFMCYDLADREMLLDVNLQLMRNGITTWVHDTDIEKGKDYNTEIRKGVESADNLIFFISKKSIFSEWCLKELAHAISCNKRIIPLKIDDVKDHEIPEILRTLQFIDFTDNEKGDDFRKDVDDILREIERERDYHRYHKMLLIQALHWENQSHKASLLLRGFNLENAETWLRLHNDRTIYAPIELQKKYIVESRLKKGEVNTEIFISYSRKDSDFARKLNRALQEAGKTTWFDQESISDGVDFSKEIFKGIQQSANFLFIISPDSLASKFCDDELAFAAENGKRFIPIVLRESENANARIAENSKDYALINWLYFTNQTQFQSQFLKLIQSIETDFEHVHAHTKWQQRAVEWHENHRSKDYLLNNSAFQSASLWQNEALETKKQPLMTNLQKDFFAESEKAIAEAQEKERKINTLLEKRLKVARKNQRYAIYGVVVAVLLIAVAAFFGIMAEDAAKRAKLASNNAEENLNKANNLIRAFSFYDDKFALANADTFYYFMDKEGNKIEKLGDWDIAGGFDENGWATVVKDDQEYLLDTLGNFYVVAHDIYKLTPETQALDLRHNDLTEMPKNIEKYQRLQVLLLGGNNLENSVWNSLEKLTNLTYISLKNNQITEISSKITNLKKLHFLDVSQNQIESVPASVVELEALNVLNLSKNHISSIELPLNKLKKLTYLNLASNQFATLPEEVCEITNLKKLDLSENQINALTPNLKKIKGLTDLILNKNKLVNIPDEVFTLISLRNLSLDYNKIEILPEKIGQLSQLKFLNLKANKLKSLPNEIGKLTNLSHLNLVQNNIIRLPDDFSKLKQLNFLSLKSNKLSEFPQEVLSLSNLYHLDLSGNVLKIIPDEIANLKNLTKLSFLSCQLTEISPKIGQLKMLRNWDLNDNKSLKFDELCAVLSGFEQKIELTSVENTLLGKNLIINYNNEVPEILEDIMLVKKLTRLVLQDKNIKKLPETIGELSFLEELNLNRNSISVIPTSIGKLKNLKKLFLEANLLTIIPNEITNLENLEKLSLNKNPFKKFPIQICKLNKLEYIKLESCNLTDVPAEFSHLKNLKTLSIAHNALTTFPKSITDLENLELLSFHNNQISEFPEAIFLMKNLKILLLASNKIETLPNTISPQSDIEVLDLENNGLISLPSTMVNLKKLQTLNLSLNEISPDELNDILQTMLFVKTLYLQNMSLTALPRNLFNLENLESVYLQNIEGQKFENKLSQNDVDKLIGKLPTTFVKYE